MSRHFASLAFIKFLVFGTILFWSQPCEANWMRTYGGSGSDWAYFVQQTKDEGYIVSGETALGSGGDDAWVMKLDSLGNVTWQKTYGGTRNDYAWSVQQTADEGYIITGQTTSFGVGNSDIWLLKLNGTGDIAWQKTYGGTSNDYAWSVQQTADEGYIIAGQTTSFGAGEGDAWVMKLDSLGNVTWQKTYGGSGDDRALSIHQTADEGYIIVGETYSFGSGDCDAWVMKLDSLGNVTWQKTYGGSKYDAAWSVQQTADGGYIVAGLTTSFGAGDCDAWVMKLDSLGSITWQKAYGGTKYDAASYVRKTTDGSYIVTGVTNTGAWAMKLDSVGNVAWQKTYGGKYGSNAWMVGLTADAGYVVAGYTQSFGTWNYNALLLKLDGNGSVGSCPYEEIATAVANDTTAMVVETTAITDTTSVTGVNTTVVPVDSAATSSEICPLCDNPLTLKAGLTRKRQGEGTITSSDTLIDCPDSCQAAYNPGVTITLIATPSDLSTFMGWKPTPPGCEPANPECLITMDRKQSVKAAFQGPNKLKVVTKFKKGGTGTVTSGDTFINCPGDCEEPYILNAPVTLTANAGAGSTFVKWTGNSCRDESTNVCTLEMKKNTTVKAIFAPTS
jgi:hypothetical protein